MSSNKNSVLDATIGPRLLGLCSARDVSFSELSRRTEINRSTLTRMLKGQRPVQAAELTRILKVLRVRRCDFFPQTAVVGPPLPEPTAAPPEQLQVDIQALEDQLRLAIEQRDDLADQVERLCAELRVERSERVNEIAELRDQHMREIVELRRKFHAAQAATLEEAQARDEKASAALGAVAELNSREQAASHGPRDARSPRPAPPPGPRPREGNAPSWAEAATGIAVGLGGLALGTWLIASKRS